MRIFKTRWMTRFTRRETIMDGAFLDAVARAERGLVDADLGGGLIKQRVARLGRGRNGGYRILIGYKAGYRAILLYGFAKNELDNIGEQQLVELRALASFWLSASAAVLLEALGGPDHGGRR